MDFLIGGFAKARLAGLEGALLQDFETLLTLPDPELEGLVWGKKQLDEGSNLTEILALVRAFHAIDLSSNSDG